MAIPEIKPSEVKRRTGFLTALDLVSYTIAMCNADLDRTQKRVPCLTWFEEWFLYFRWSYGHTCEKEIHLMQVWGCEKQNNRTFNKIKI